MHHNNADMSREELALRYQRKKREMLISDIKRLEKPFKDKDGFIITSNLMKGIKSPDSFIALWRKVFDAAL